MDEGIKLPPPKRRKSVNAAERIFLLTILVSEASGDFIPARNASQKKDPPIIGEKWLKRRNVFSGSSKKLAPCDCAIFSHASL